MSGLTFEKHAAFDVSLAHALLIAEVSTGGGRANFGLEQEHTCCFSRFFTGNLHFGLMMTSSMQMQPFGVKRVPSRYTVPDRHTQVRTGVPVHSCSVRSGVAGRMRGVRRPFSC